MDIVLNVPDLMEEIISKISDPRSFLNILQLNKEWNRLGSKYIEDKKKLFLSPYHFTDSKGLNHEVKRFPNGNIQGEERITDKDDNLLITRNWSRGKLHGIEQRYMNGNVYNKIPWHYGKKNGIQTKYMGGEKFSIFWDNNIKIKREVYGNNNIMHTLDHYSSNHSFVRNKLNGNQQMIREGIYVNNEKHGVHKTFVGNILYLNGIEQLWYTEETWLMIIYLILLFFVLYCIYQATAKQSWKPITNNYYFFYFVIILFVIPILWAIWKGGKILFI